MTDPGSILEPALERPACEHIAALLRSAEDLPPLLASFYRLGSARNGWLAHGSRPGMVMTDRTQLAAAGLDVGALEASGQLAVMELDLTVAPDEWVKPWSELLEQRLRSGFAALWFARFPIGPSEEDVSGVLPYEAAWMDSFRGRPVVTLCPYIVGGLDGDERARHRMRVADAHERVLDFASG